MNPWWTSQYQKRILVKMCCSSLLFSLQPSCDSWARAKAQEGWYWGTVPPLCDNDLKKKKFLNVFFFFNHYQQWGKQQREIWKCLDVLKIKCFVVIFLQPRLCVEASQTICSAELLVSGGAACASLQWSCCGCETVCLLKEVRMALLVLMLLQMSF